MIYRVEYDAHIEKDFATIPARDARLILTRTGSLENNPRPPGCKKLHGNMGYRLRQGVYRILYTIDDSARLVRVYRIRHRREAYR